MGHGGAKHITPEMFEPWEKYQGCVNFVRGPKDKRYPPRAKTPSSGDKNSLSSDKKSLRGQKLPLRAIKSLLEGQ